MLQKLLQYADTVQCKTAISFTVKSQKELKSDKKLEKRKEALRILDMFTEEEIEEIVAEER